MHQLGRVLQGTDVLPIRMLHDDDQTGDDGHRRVFGTGGENRGSGVPEGVHESREVQGRHQFVEQRAVLRHAMVRTDERMRPHRRRKLPLGGNAVHQLGRVLQGTDVLPIRMLHDDDQTGDDGHRKVQQMVAAVSQRQRMYHIRQHHVLERVLRVQRLANVERERLHRDVVDDRGGWNVRVVPGGCGVRVQRRNPRDRWGLLHVWVLHGPQIETGVRRGRESRRVLGVRSGLGENDLRCRVRKSVRPIQKMQGRYQFVEHGAVLRSPMVRNGGVHESRRHGSRDPTVWTGDGGGVHVQRRLDDDRLVSRQSKTEQRGPVRPGLHVRPRLRYQDRQMRRQQSADGSV